MALEELWRPTSSFRGTILLPGPRTQFLSVIVGRSQRSVSPSSSVPHLLESRKRSSEAIGLQPGATGPSAGQQKRPYAIPSAHVAPSGLSAHSLELTQTSTSKETTPVFESRHSSEARSAAQL